VRGDASMMFEIGSTVGDYRIVGAIGTGGAGRLFKGRHKVTGRVEALKVLQSDSEQTRESILRFLREIRLQASLDHPNIARVFNAFHEDGQLVMAMEYVEGHSLREILNDGPLEIPQAIDYACQALDALAYAHEVEVSHRDIKPENILITPGGRLKLTDFGLAKIWSGVSLTQAAPPLGSLRYMSPEQVHASSNLDGRTDIYSLGAVLYEMVTGQPPFEQEKPFELMKAHAESPPRPPMELRDIPGQLNGAILGALQKEPAARYAGAHEFRQALEQVPAVPGQEMTAPKRVVQGPLLRLWKPALGVTAGLAAAFLAVTAVASWQTEPRQLLPPPELPANVTPARPPAFAYEKLPLTAEAQEPPRPIRAQAEMGRPRARAPQPPTQPEVINLETPEPPAEDRTVTASLLLPDIPEPDLRVGPPPLEEPGRGLAAPSEAPSLRLSRQWPAMPGAGRVLFGTDGENLAVYGDRGFQIWDTQSGDSVAELWNSDGQITALALAPGGHTLFLGSSDGTVRSWETGSRRYAGMLGHSSGVTSLSLSHDGRVLLVGLQDRSVHVWRKTGDENRYERSATRRISRRPPARVAFAGPAELVTAVSPDRVIQVWNVIGGNINRITALDQGATAVAFSPDGSVLAAAGQGEMGLWHVYSGQRIKGLASGGAHYALSFLESGRCVAIAAEGRTVSVWDVISSELLATVGADASVSHVAVSPDGSQVAALDADGQIYQWRWNEPGRENLTRRIEPDEMARLLEEVAGVAEKKRGPFRRLFDSIR